MKRQPKFERNEFNYLAMCLIFGPRCPFLSVFDSFSFSTFKKEKKLNVREMDIMEDGIYKKSRSLVIDDNRAILAKDITPTSDICRILSFQDPANKVFLSDALYTDYEFKRFNYDFNENTRAKIQNVGLLIQTLHQWDLTLVPLFVSEFPNISKVILNHPEFLEKSKRTSNEH